MWHLGSTTGGDLSSSRMRNGLMFAVTNMIYKYLLFIYNICLFNDHILIYKYKEELRLFSALL